MSEHTVDELIELGAAAVPEVFTALGAITATAEGDGVEVRVNLEGRIIALTVDPAAMTSPASLAATIFRLTQEASATALHAGIEALAPAAGEELVAELRALVLPVAPPPAPVDEDYSAVETWAVPR